MIIKFFITPIYPYGNDHYYHEIISVAEGFIALGHKIIGNTDYWFMPEKNEYLINANSDEDFDIGIYDYRFAQSFEHLLFRKGYPNKDKGKIHILIDRNDDITPIWLNKEYFNYFDLLFVGNLLDGVCYHSKIIPFTYGLTNRIISTIDSSFDTTRIEDNSIGHNFRINHNMRGHVMNGLSHVNLKYPLNLKLTEKLEDKSIQVPPNDLFYWKQTTKRHNPEYYKILNTTLMFCGFGGFYEFKPKIIYQPYNLIDKIRRKPYFFYSKILEMLNQDISPAVFVFQYDNFRFWEIMYSRSCAINLSFDSWKFKLPVKPKANEHYLAIDKFNFKKFADQVNHLGDSAIQEIGLNGREWIKNTYSPVCMANMILEKLDEKKVQ